MAYPKMRRKHCVGLFIFRVNIYLPMIDRKFFLLILTQTTMNASIIRLLHLIALKKETYMGQTDARRELTFELPNLNSKPNLIWSKPNSIRIDCNI